VSTGKGTETETQKNSLRKFLDTYIETQLKELITQNLDSRFISYFYIIQLLKHSFKDKEENFHEFFKESQLFENIKNFCNQKILPRTNINKENLTNELYSVIIDTLEITQPEIDIMKTKSSDIASEKYDSNSKILSEQKIIGGGFINKALEQAKALATTATGLVNKGKALATTTTGLSENINKNVESLVNDSSKQANLPINPSQHANSEYSNDSTDQEKNECKDTLTQLLDSCSSGQGESSEGMHKELFYIVKNKFENCIKDKTTFMVEDSQVYEAARKERRPLTKEEKKGLKSIRYYAFSHISEYIDKKSECLIQNTFLSQYDIKFHKELLKTLFKDDRIGKIIKSAIYSVFISNGNIDSYTIRDTIIDRLNPYYILDTTSNTINENNEVGNIQALLDVTTSITDTTKNKYNKDDVVTFDNNKYKIVQLIEGTTENGGLHLVIQKNEDAKELKLVKAEDISLVNEEDNKKNTEKTTGEKTTGGNAGVSHQLSTKKSYSSKLRFKKPFNNSVKAQHKKKYKYSLKNSKRNLP
jgi:hypothetical protein